MSGTPQVGTPDGVGVVLPGDNRARVANSTVMPARWIGQLTSSWPDGSTTIGTAVLLDDQHLLTCAHNFYNTRTRQFCSGAVFRPAANRSDTGDPVVPYGSYAVRRFAVPQEYQLNGGPPPPLNGVQVGDITRYLHDYGVARLQRAVPDPPGSSLLAPGWPGADVVQQQNCTIIGYSGDLDDTAHTQYTRSGPVRVDDNEEFVSYTMSTYHGDSGAPVFYQPHGRNYWTVVAVHVTGVQAGNHGPGLNFGPAMTEEVLADIQSLIAQVDQ